MSPLYAFKCDVCDTLNNCVLMSVDDYEGQFTCPYFIDDAKCAGTMKRVFNAPAVGRVPGGGGSPSRGSL